MSKEIAAVATSKPVLGALALPFVGLAAAVLVGTGVFLYRRHRFGESDEEKAKRLERAYHSGESFGC